MDSVLIVSNTSSTMGILSQMLASQPFSRIAASQSGSQARRSLLDGDFDIVIIDSPLPDENGDDLALHASENQTAGVILLAPAERLMDIPGDLEESGVFVLPKPLSPELFYQSVKLLMATKNKIQRLEEENKNLLRKIEEIKTVSQAKCLLIERRKMTESEAHRYIEKEAMNRRESRLIVAESILKSYGF